MRAKTVFAKHCDSVLQKTAKLRSLVVDLQKNYAEDETARLQLATMIIFLPCWLIVMEELVLSKYSQIPHGNYQRIY